MTQPQSAFNQLTTFEPEAEIIHAPVPAALLNRTYSMNIQELEKPEFMNKPTRVTEDTLEILMSFVLDLYETPGKLTEDGTLAKGTIAPWAKRSDTPEPTKERIKDIINQTTPRLFTLTESKLWQLNIRAYPDYDSVCDAIETCRVRKRG